MRSTTVFTTILLFVAAGCRTTERLSASATESGRPAAAVRAPGRATRVAEVPTPVVDPADAEAGLGNFREVSRLTPRPSQQLTIQRVAHQQDKPREDTFNGGTIQIDGRQYRVSVVERESAAVSGGPIQLAASQNDGAVNVLPAAEQLEPLPVEQVVSGSARTNGTLPEAGLDAGPDALLINLPTALSLISGDHPAVGLARWRVQEAYGRVDQADVMWLPSLQAGLSFHRHDGNYQASNGAIVDVNRSSFQYGLGAGGTGAGTTPRPGLQAQFHLADALFEPEIARRTAWAHGHAERAAVNRQLREVAVAYTGLLNASQQLRIVEESRSRVATIAQLTRDFAAAGQGLQADADRMETELTLIDARMIGRREEVELASSRLAHALSSDPSRRIVPLDAMMVPLELHSAQTSKASMIQSGLRLRPELKESQALVAAACERYRREKTAPFVPSLLLGFSTSGFGGGVGSTLDNIDGRYDLDAVMTWEIRNLGLGEAAARRTAESRVQQAMFAKLRRMDDVARQISDALTQTRFRRERMLVTQQAIVSAENSYDRNLSRIRDGQGLPLEVLQSVQALEDAQRAYAESVAAYNVAQFQLQWAMGWQIAVSE